MDGSFLFITYLNRGHHISDVREKLSNFIIFFVDQFWSAVYQEEFEMCETQGANAVTGDKLSFLNVFPDQYAHKDQTEADIAAYYRAALPGDIAVVCETQGHTLSYYFMRIEGVKFKIGRVYVRHFGAFYAKHGKNCFHPKGQTFLVVPTEAVIHWAETHSTLIQHDQVPLDEVRLSVAKDGRP